MIYQQASELKKNIAYLEYVNAQLLEELLEADRILRRIGFEEGLETVKAAANEIIRMQEGLDGEIEDDLS